MAGGWVIILCVLSCYPCPTLHSFPPTCPAAYSRPMRWLLALHGDTVLPFTYAGLQAGVLMLANMYTACCCGLLHGVTAARCCPQRVVAPCVFMCLE